MKVNLAKRIVAMLIIVMMLVSALPLSVLAASSNVYVDTKTNESSSNLPNILENDGLIDFPLTFREVATLDELQAALTDGIDAICLTSDMEIDRTFYITTDTIIYCERAVTITRSASFAGDMFVVGQNEDLTLCKNGVTFSLGSASEHEKDILTINGNSENMTVSVVGTVIFVCPNSQADLYGNLVITNNKKTGNERTLQSVHGLSNASNVGGAVAILSDDATMNVYGGVYSNNSVNTSGESIWGGTFYNFGKLNVYDATISGGYALRAGAIYNYRTLYIYGAEIRNNSSTTYGGAIYLPASSGAKIYMGLENEYVNGKVIFADNSATSGAGAIYSAGTISGQNVTFEGNSSKEGGAIYASGKYSTTSLENSSFIKNSSTSAGGALRIGGHNTLNNDIDLTLKNVSFVENTASTGAAISLAEENVSSFENLTFTKNATTSSGGAMQIVGATVNMNNVTLEENTASSGVIHISASSNVTVNKLMALNNTTTGSGGAIYATEATVNVYNSTFKSNKANAGSGVYMYTNATGGIYTSSFIGNSCNEANTGNAATAFIYTGGTEFTLHSCSFIQNTSNGYGGALTVSGKTIGYLYNITAIENSAGKGGFAYITSSGTVVTMSGITISGNTASDGGPIIWGNTTGAKLNINKNNFFDLDTEGALDDAYWSAAIANKLTVIDTDVTVPSYTDHSGEIVSGSFSAVIVKTAEELEKALADKASMIRITFDIAIDKTVYIDYDVTIFSTSQCKIYRADGFTGDMFVMGNEELTPISVSLGLEESNTPDYLIIDGSSSDTIEGRIAVLNEGVTLNVYDNVTFTGANSSYGALYVTKNASTNVYGGKFTKNFAKYGAIQNNGTANVYGGTFTENEGEYGGAFYNNGTLTVTGGEFSLNTARLGGAIYNRSTLSVSGAIMIQNTATENGGALYVYKGNVILSGIAVENNSAVNGGAIALVDGVTTLTNVSFNANKAELGGALHLSANADLTASENSFVQNEAILGGAVYSSINSVDIRNSALNMNKAQKGGAIALVGVRKIEFVSLTAQGNTAENGGFAYAENSVFGLKNSQISENVAELGGAICLCNSDLNSYADMFTSNNATEGGAIYSENGSVTLNKSSFTSNYADYDGGAIRLIGAYMSMSASEAMLNTADNDGGFLFATDSEMDIIASEFVKNSAQMNGGAIAFESGASAAINQSTFKENRAYRNGGAISARTNGSAIKTKLCTFENNTADKLGGAVYASSKSVLELYTSQATTNKAERGGFLYLTDSNTTVTVNEITVSGNSATNGPIVYGTSPAVLYINKEAYTDTAKSELNSTYFASALFGTLTVKAIFDIAPDFAEINESNSEGIKNPYDVSSAQELEQAIARGEKYIRIVADFEIDRTFYITQTVTIFSTAQHTLTRASDFGGDVFVVGEYADGTNSMLEKADAKLILGSKDSSVPNLLIFDGNKSGMTVDVYGTLIFICNGAVADLYSNVTVRNLHKNSNLKTLEEKYSLSRPERVGGALAIITFGAVNVYGGNYINNSVREQTDTSEAGRASTIGGLFYNESNLRIYDGFFQGNEAARGGIVYNYCVTKIFGGSFISNIASIGGAVYYAPSSAASHLNIGFESDKEILFKDNVAQTSGGVIYSSTLNGTVIHGNTRFENNKVIDGNGGVIYITGMLTLRNTVFCNNSASYGGAIYFSRTSANYASRHVEIENCEFDGNSANYGGALALYSDEEHYDCGSIVTVKGSTFTSNESKNSGGALFVDRKSILKVYNTVISGNVSSSEAGAIYILGQSTVDIYDSVLTGNASQSHGGAISVRSSYLNVTNTEISSNSSSTGNGGAIYISYSSALDNNSIVNINGSVIKGNSTPNNGGAIYATRRAIDGDTKVLNVKFTDFAQNIAGDNGGAILLTGGVDVYMNDVSFVSNSTNIKTDGSGGAITVLSSKLELDGGVFTKNTSLGTGGAIQITGTTSAVTLNNITATRNEARSNGGFMYSECPALKIYNSQIKSNKSSMGGGIYLFEGASSEIYNTDFEKNTTSGNGAALFVYTYGTNTTVQDCSFEQNIATGSGGAIYASGESILKLYNIVAKNNSSTNGGFMYETKAGTVVTIVGLTYSGNTATSGGSLIWGNTANADLYLNKSSCVDLDYNGALDDVYWSGVIKGSLTIQNTQEKIPSYTDYKSSLDPVVTNKVKNPVLVSEIFDLAINSSDAFIDKIYDKLPMLDNSSNFMSNQTTFFENINGETVSVDTYVYENYSASGNMNVGQGLMIYQAMLYKQANPDEEVYIDIASYRFSVEAAVNINRDSRYFGYMRQLSSTNYDKYGFVRISYLLVSAAKMGIHVNVMGHSEAYPLTGSDRLETYFTNYFDHPCDPSYVKDGVIGDYMTFSKFEWTIGGSGGKGGTDMMHVKLCAVSHYLDMNGNVHKNAVWTSSSNLDGIYNNYGGYNANWKQQTATIISDHAEIYNVATNYLRLLPKYKHQEGILEFQNYINEKSTEQIDLTLAGKANQISKEEQIVYIGTENDDVFEFYFTPFAGDVLGWSEIYNPYAKYLRELYDSEDYIVFTWNAAEYSGNFPLAQQIEQMIIDAFHNNKNPKNKIYANMESFDASTFDDLVVGVDIGFKSINKWEQGAVHNKDLQFSYVKNGQRYYVSLLNSCNLHSGSMYYQANQALVIKETSCSSTSVFSTVARISTTGQMVEHTPGEVQIRPATADAHGCKYTVCQICGEEEIVSTLHHESEWIIDREASSVQNGIRHIECTLCGELMQTQELLYTGKEFILNAESWIGKTFGYTTAIPIEISKSPLTFEATVQLSKDYSDRGGVIVSNYGKDTNNAISIEIYTNGRVRLFFVNQGMRVDCLFETDIRSDEKTHIAITANGQEASLYVNGKLAETKHLSCSLPKLTNDFKIGGDNRGGNAQYFKGTIYSVSLFNDVRTAGEIANDSILVLPNANGLIYSEYFTKDAEELKIDSEKLNALLGEEAYELKDSLSSTPNTIEATVKLPNDLSQDIGVIVGNYVNNTIDSLGLEIIQNGLVKLSIISGGVREDIIFSTALKANTVSHIAVTFSDGIATLYVNGVSTDAKTISVKMPNATGNYIVGGDVRAKFKGELYSVNLFADVRTASEIMQDMVLVSRNTDGLLASLNFNEDGTVTEISGQKFDKDTTGAVDYCISDKPLTFEAIINVPKDLNDRAGVIVSNYGTGEDAFVLEIIDGGRPRFYIKRNGESLYCIFNVDIRSDGPVHIAITFTNKIARLYVNGEHRSTMGLALPLPDSISNLMIGGDGRTGNSQYFKGTIYSVALFNDVRTLDEIKSDAIFIPSGTDGLIYQGYFAKSVADKLTTIHKNTVFVIDVPDSSDDGGFGHYECVECGKIIKYVSFVSENQIVNSNDYTDSTAGIGPNEKYPIEGSFSSVPLTYEALIQLPKSFKDRAGVVMGNYDASPSNQINIEIYNNGAPRLYYKVGNVGYSYVFKTDIRSDKAVHIAITVDQLTAKLYVNGVFTESVTLTAAFPTTTPLSFVVGADNRATNPQTFKGVIYSASMFSDVRTDEEIKLDTIMVASDSDNLLFSEFFVNAEQVESTGPWAGTTGVFIGDSITAGTGCDGKTYWEILGEALELETTIGMGVAGSCISETSNYGSNHSPLINRLDKIPAADLITVFMGTNDYGHDTPLGTINDMTDVSFYGALNVIIPALLEKNPDATIVFITPLHRYGYGTNSTTGEAHTYDSIPNGAGYTLEDYVNAIKEVCEKYSIDVIDLYELSDLDPSIELTREQYMEDGLHLNANGHNYISQILEYWLNEIGNAKAE